jgi:hypothetical protein
MSKQSRILNFGGAGLLVALGVGVGVAVGGGAGQVVAIVLVGLGLVAAVSLVFYEVGLSEDRERTRAEERARTRAGEQAPRRPKTARRVRPVARLPRRRGQHRRLR